MGMIPRLAALWGFAEATLFFIVPDVLLTFIAIRHGWQRAAITSLAAAAGAVMGGALMYAWAASNPASARGAIDFVPAISASLLERAKEALARDGLAAMFVGAFTGAPYKVYAVEAGASASNPWAFLALTLPARLLRFLAAILLASALAWSLSRMFGAAAIVRIFAGVWIVFYLAYFSLMAN